MMCVTQSYRSVTTKASAHVLQAIQALCVKTVQVCVKSCGVLVHTGLSRPNFYFLTVVNECALGTSNCDQVCTDTAESFTCSCHDGYVLQPDGHSCECGGTFTAGSGSFQTPGWPDSYPQENFQCVWIVDVAGAGSIEFNINTTAFGINGRSPCTNDHIQFFDGTGSNAASLDKICGSRSSVTLTPITTSSSSAKVVFTGSANPSRPASRVGVKVDYTTGGKT